MSNFWEEKRLPQTKECNHVDIHWSDWRPFKRKVVSYIRDGYCKECGANMECKK